MPDSMFGPPSQHLLPSHPLASAGGSPVDPHALPVQPTPVSFKDFRFNSIGKQPELLSRISLPQPDHADYRSPTPSPTITPPAFTNDGAFRSKSSLRPTLFQQLARNDFSRAMDGGSSRHASTSQSNRSLASRIQMDDNPSKDVVNVDTAHCTASSSPLPSPRVNSVRRATNDTSLIPPVEVLPQLSEPSSPTSLVPALEPLDVHSPTSSTPLMNTTTTRISQIPTPPTIATNTAPGELMEHFPSSAVVYANVQDMQPSPTVTVAIDSLVARQERLQAISTNLANLASPLLPPSPQSSSTAALSASQANDNTIPHQSSHPQHNLIPMFLHDPYLDNQTSGRVGLNINDIPTNTNDSSLALIHSPTTITQENQTQRQAIVEAVRNLNSALNAVHRAQIDNENILALQINTFDEQRAAFEQTKRAEEAAMHKEFQELQRKRDELNAKEALLASLEQESKAREVARKAMLAKRQAQEEEKRAAQTKRMEEVQEQIAAAMTELNEVEALKAKSRLEQLVIEAVPDDLPTELQESMDEEEMAVIKSRNDLLRAVKHLRRMHSDKVQKLEKSNRTLRRLEEERKQREAEVAERHRIEEEERLRAHAEAERARQVLDAKQRETERKRQEVENDREEARLLVDQQVRADAQARGSRRTEVTSGRTPEYRGHPEEVSISQQQSITDATRLRAAPEANSLSSEITTAMSVNKDGKASARLRSVPSSDVRTSPGGSQSATAQLKRGKDGRISGSVVLAASTSKNSPGHLPPKPLTKPPLLSASDHVAENALNPARTSPAFSVPTEDDGHESSFPTQLASEFNRVANGDIHQTPNHKPPFSRTPKSQTLLETTIGGSEEFIIGPVTGVSPAQQNVNLRHLKRYHSRIEENDSGDRSVRTNVKNEELNSVSLQREGDEQFRERVRASLPHRPAIISPPRPRRRHAAPAFLQMNSSSSYPPASNKLSSIKGEGEVITDELPREALSRGSSSSQAMNASVQLPVPAGAADSLLVGPVYAEPQPTESPINAGERSAQDRAENHDSTSFDSASAALSHEYGEDRSRNNKRFTDEHRRARNGNSARRPPGQSWSSSVTSRTAVTSPTQPQRPIDSWRPQYSFNAPRAESIRATSPTTGRKRPSEYSDHDQGHRTRRQRSDVWIAQDHDHDRVDSYRLHGDRHLDSEPEERRTTYRIPASPPDPTRSYPSDIPRAVYDNRTHIPPFSEEPTALVARREQSYRRPESDDTYHRYHPLPGFNVMAGPHHTDDAREDQTYEPTAEMDGGQPDPSLLARITNTQRFPPSTNFRARGRGEPNRARGDFGRGRGRGVARGGPALIERLTSGPSLGDRLT